MTATVPETVVFDVEPLVAYCRDEPGSDVVERHIEAVEGTLLVGADDDGTEVPVTRFRDTSG